MLRPNFSFEFWNFNQSLRAYVTPNLVQCLNKLIKLSKHISVPVVSTPSVNMNSKWVNTKTNFGKVYNFSLRNVQFDGIQQWRNGLSKWVNTKTNCGKVKNFSLRNVQFDGIQQFVDFLWTGNYDAKRSDCAKKRAPPAWPLPMTWAIAVSCWA